VSGQSVCYPNPEHHSNIYHFTETLQQPLNQKMTALNAPKMYKSDKGDNVVCLDELVINEELDINLQFLYPRGSVPLGQSNDYYTGDFIENIETGETREIVGFLYETDELTDIIFQSGEIVDFTSTGGSYHVVVDAVNVLNENIFSNIPNFYVGKFIRKSGSSKKVIINEYLTNTLTNTFVIPSFLELEKGDRIEIVSDRRWYAVLREPFSTPLPSYPCFRIPLPRNQIQLNTKKITDTNSEITYITHTEEEVKTSGENRKRIIYMEDNGTSVNGYPISNIKFISGYNDGLLDWNVNDSFIATDNAITHSLTTSGLVDGAFQTSIYYATDNNSTTEYDVKLQRSIHNSNVYTNEKIIDTYNPTIDPSVLGLADDVGFNKFFSFYRTPIYDEQYIGIVYSYVDENAGVYTSYLKYIYSNNHEYGEPLTHITIESNSSTTLSDLDIYNVLDVELLDNNIPAVLYSKTFGNIFRFQYRIADNELGTSWTSPPIFSVHDGTTSSTSVKKETEYIFVDLKVVNAYDTRENVPMVITYTNDFGGQPRKRIMVNMSSTIDGNNEADWQKGHGDILFLWPTFFSEVKGAKIAQTIDPETEDRTIYVFGWGDNGIQYSYLEEDYINSSSYDEMYDKWKGPITITNQKITAFDVVENKDTFSLIYSSDNLNGSWSVYSSVSVDNVKNECSHYRIRKDKNILSGCRGELQKISSKEYCLVEPSDLINGCEFIHIKNPNTYFEPDEFIPVNEFAFIKSYDKTTGCITLSKPLSVDTEEILPPASSSSRLALYGSNSLDVGEDFSQYGNHFNVGSDVSYVLHHTDDNGLRLNDVICFNDGSDVLTRTLTDSLDELRWGLNHDGTNQRSKPNLYISFFIKLNDTSPSSGDIIRFYSGGDDFIDVSLNGDTITFNTYYRDEFTVLNTNVSTPDPLPENIWMHIAFVINNGIIQLYMNGELIYTENDIFNTKLQGIPFTDVRIGRRVDVYMKDIIIGMAPMQQENIIDLYNHGLGIKNYVCFDILGDIKENYSPLDYFCGNVLVSHEECYILELKRLTLPNKGIKTGFGNRIAFYPYVYVVFYNTDKKLEKHIHSNNPNVPNAMFTVPIRDTSSPDRAVFVNNSSPMSIRTKFSPYRNFVVGIYLYNGELLEFREQDTQSPSPPDPLLQVAMTIGFKKI
jgi:hypothetical protein